ncbi:MAG: hypothetical protein ACRDP9_04355 [Kribbellaceae bacterium]
MITDTAAVHARAWRQLLDEYAAARAQQPGEDHSPFTDEDYLRNLDGPATLRRGGDFPRLAGASSSKYLSG